MAKTAAEKLLEAREMLFGVSQALWTVSAVLKDREMPATAQAVSDLAEMAGEFSSSLSADEVSA